MNVVHDPHEIQVIIASIADKATKAFEKSRKKTSGHANGFSGWNHLRVTVRSRCAKDVSQRANCLRRCRRDAMLQRLEKQTKAIKLDDHVEDEPKPSSLQQSPSADAKLSPTAKSFLN